MSRVLEFVNDLIDSGIDFYRRSILCKAICDGLCLLFGVLLLDGFFGFQTGTRMAYVLPIWIATKRGGRQAGATVVLVTTIALAIVDSAQKGRTNSVLLNVALQTGVLYSLMRIFDGVESKLRTVTTLAMKDSLTGLLNRFEVEDRARKAIDRSMVLGHPVTLAMIDCDHFKELNDKFGHSYGDDVLRIISKTMRRTFAADAIIGRAGGDEFIVVFPNRDRYQAMSLLDAALDRFMSHAEVVGRSTGFSFGLAVVGEDGIEYEQLMRSADEDMYRSKANRSIVEATSLAS